MSGLNNVPTKRVCNAFKRAGWVIEIEGSKHTLLCNPNKPTVALSIPRHKYIKQGLLRRLIRNAGLSTEEFLQLI